MQVAYVRRHWRELLSTVGVAIILSPIALTFPERARWFFWGAWSTGILGLLAHFVILLSGSARLVMADQAEQWTRQAVDPVRRAGWKVIHRVLFRRYGDIDTIAVGSPGVVVIETKWTSGDWTSPGQHQWIEAAVKQAADNSALVRRQIQQQVGPVQAWPVVALWPSDPELQPREMRGVTVLPGLELQRWIESLPVGMLSPESVNAAWSFLEAHVARRDANDLEVNGTPPRSPARYMADVLQYPLGAVLGLWMLSVLDWLTKGPLVLVPLAILTVAAAWVRRVEVIRRLAAGVLVTTTALLPLTGIVAIIELVVN